MKAKVQTITAEQAQVIADLIQLDIETVETYRHALPQINEQTIADNLLKCCEDHEAHIQELSAILLADFYEPPAITQEFKSLLIKGATTLSGLIGTGGFLKTLQANEETIHKKYVEVNALSFPEKIKNIIIKNLQHEQRHLTQLKQLLK